MIIKDISEEPKYSLEVSLSELLTLERSLHYVGKDTRFNADFRMKAANLEEILEEVTLKRPEKRNASS